MKKTLFGILLLLSSLCVSAQIKIVDMTDSSTVHAASVFISGNRCVGVSGADGLLPLPKGYKGKVTVNHINYYEKQFLADTVSSGVVMLKPRAYAIPEVEAKVGEPDYLVISAYCRAYIYIPILCRLLFVRDFMTIICLSAVSVPRNIRACHLSLRDLSAKEG